MRLRISQRSLSCLVASLTLFSYKICILIERPSLLTWGRFIVTFLFFVVYVALL